MGRVIVIEFVTLDGVITDPDGSGRTPYGGWAFRHGPETVAGDKFRLGDTMDSGMMLLGRKTWELFASLWPNRSDPFSQKMNAIPKRVATRSAHRPVRLGELDTDPRRPARRCTSRTRATGCDRHREHQCAANPAARRRRRPVPVVDVPVRRRLRRAAVHCADRPTADPQPTTTGGSNRALLLRPGALRPRTAMTRVLDKGQATGACLIDDKQT